MKKEMKTIEELLSHSLHERKIVFWCLVFATLISSVVTKLILESNFSGQSLPLFLMIVLWGLVFCLFGVFVEFHDFSKKLRRIES